MGVLEFVEFLSKKYSIPKEDLIKQGTELTLQEKKRKYLIEKLEILSKHGANSVEELRKNIEEGTTSEHPGWEDLIEIKNIDAEIKEIENDIRALQSS